MSKKTMVNETTICGYLYNHELEHRVAGKKSKNPGASFIRGSIDIATDKDCLNVVTVFFTYVTPMTKDGKTNATYIALESIIAGKSKSIMADGIENATLFRVNSAIALNDFVARDGTMVSQRRNEGGFVHNLQNLEEIPTKQRSTWKADMVITSCVRREADEEKNIPERMTIRGCAFNFRKDILPIEVVTYNPAAMDYFEGLDASEKHPVFTQIWGEQVSQTIVKKTVQESAFGEPQISETRSTYREFVVSGAKPEPYEWDTEETILASELVEMMANREVHLADVKKRNDEWKASQSGSGVASAVASAKVGEFKF